MDDGGWLSTRNRKKVPQHQPRLQKRRSSTLKPLKSTFLQVSHSPPPKQLFTATKQSSLKDFFSAGEEQQLEVEVNLDDDSQSGCSENVNPTQTHLALVETEKTSECRNAELVRQKNKSETFYEKNRCFENSQGPGTSKGKESPKQSYHIDSLELEVNDSNKTIKNVALGHSENKASIAKIKKENRHKNEYVGKINHLDSLENADNRVETDRVFVKRKRNQSESDCNLCPSVKRTVSNVSLCMTNAELTDNFESKEQVGPNDKCIELSENTTEAEQYFTEDFGSVSEYDGISQDLRVPMSCFSSQSLHLDSQMSLHSQQSVELQTNSFILDTQNHRLPERFRNKDLLKLGSLPEDTDKETFDQNPSSNSPMFDSQIDGIDHENDDISFTLSSQNETFDRRYEHLVSSASLDLSSQNDSFDLGTEGIETSHISHELLEVSQLDFASPLVKGANGYQSLQLP